MEREMPEPMPSMDPHSKDADKVRGELDELLNAGRVIGYSVGEAGDGKKKISVDFEMFTASPEASPEPTAEPVGPAAPPLPVAATRSVSRITKEAMEGLSEVYPKEFLRGMGLDL